MSNESDIAAINLAHRVLELVYVVQNYHIPFVLTGAHDTLVGTIELLETHLASLREKLS